MSWYITLGVDENSEVFGLEINPADNERGWDWRVNPAGYSTSCVVIRPVTKDILVYNRDDAESLRDVWKAAVSSDNTDLGLDEYFEEALSESASVLHDDEGWPCKDESFCEELLIDETNPTIEKWSKDKDGCDTFREFVEKKIYEEIPGHEIATWESAGWYPPTKPLVIELAPRWLLDEYYEHLAKTDNDFKMN